MIRTRDKTAGKRLIVSHSKAMFGVAMAYRPCNRAKMPDPLIVRRGTSPLVLFRLNQDVSDFPTVLITIMCDGYQLDFSKERMEFLEIDGGHFIRLALDQNETLSLGAKCHFQLRCVDNDGRAFATAILSANVANVINQEVLI